jgi:hypothetical protein
MNRITLKNLSSVQGLNKAEMKSVAGGQFIGTFSNSPWKPLTTRVCQKYILGRRYCYFAPYVPQVH